MMRGSLSYPATVPGAGFAGLIDRRNSAFASVNKAPLPEAHLQPVKDPALTGGVFRNGRGGGHSGE
jgi:hypothetical protein